MSEEAAKPAAKAKAKPAPEPEHEDEAEDPSAGVPDGEYPEEGTFGYAEKPKDA